MPGYVRDFIKGIPNVWDDTKFLDGEPGKFVVLARQGGDRWYVAGINGEPAVRDLALDLSRLGSHSSATLITDGGGGIGPFRHETIRLVSGGRVEITLPPYGGFVLVLD
jgi:hypothetical protein